MIMNKSVLSCLFLLLILAALPCDANAEPLGFRRPRTTFALGIDAFDTWLGDFGKAGSVGMSVYAESTIQLYGYFGVHVKIASSRAFTDKNFLPFDNGYQFLALSIAPRAYIAPFRKINLYFFIQPQLSLHILSSNTLIRITGNDPNSGAAGGAIGLQCILGILSISGQVYCDYDWNLKSVFFGGGVSIGISQPIQ